MVIYTWPKLVMKDIVFTWFHFFGLVAYMFPPYPYCFIRYRYNKNWNRKLNELITLTQNRIRHKNEYPKTSNRGMFLYITDENGKEFRVEIYDYGRGYGSYDYPTTRGTDATVSLFTKYRLARLINMIDYYQKEYKDKKHFGYE